MREMYGFRLRCIKIILGLPGREPPAINTAEGPHGKSQPSDRCMVHALIFLIAGCPKWTWASREELCGCSKCNRLNFNELGWISDCLWVACFGVASGLRTTTRNVIVRDAARYDLDATFLGELVVPVHAHVPCNTQS